MSLDDSIMWGYEQPEGMRGKEHVSFLIEQYNRNRPHGEHVHSMTELNRALLTNEIKALGNGDNTNKKRGA
ncbi:hypothetical protein [uncultured Mediterranean phage uvMED]|nr:hypothetical protein [uncultured Mediterranean phage uvMED]